MSNPFAQLTKITPTSMPAKLLDVTTTMPYVPQGIRTMVPLGTELPKEVFDRLVDPETGTIIVDGEGVLNNTPLHAVPTNIAWTWGTLTVPDAKQIRQYLEGSFDPDKAVKVATVELWGDFVDPLVDQNTLDIRGGRLVSMDFREQKAGTFVPRDKDGKPIPKEDREDDETELRTEIQLVHRVGMIQSNSTVPEQVKFKNYLHNLTLGLIAGKVDDTVSDEEKAEIHAFFQEWLQWITISTSVRKFNEAGAKPPARPTILSQTEQHLRAQANPDQPPFATTDVEESAVQPKGAKKPEEAVDPAKEPVATS